MTLHESNTEIMRPKVNILGAGIAGLSLAAQLRARKIPYEIFDRAAKPGGHNYGLSLHAQAIDDLAPKLELDKENSDVRRAVAVDRLVGGTGRLPRFHFQSESTSRTTQNGLKAQDTALRDLLAQKQQISRSCNLTHARKTSHGLELLFENGTSATAAITIDASGERSPLIARLLPNLKPEVLPYAVYHGSRYTTVSDFKHHYSEFFEDAANVQEWSLTTSKATYYIQLSRSYITFADLPSPIQERETSSNRTSNETWVEVRYTISRPARSSPDSNPDPLFNPARTRDEAKTIPPEFYNEIATALQTHESHDLSRALSKFLDVEAIKQDRILNWLMRVRCLKEHDLKSLADQGVIVIGDAAHALPILGSEGACHAISDAKMLAEWLGKTNLGSAEDDSATFRCNLYDFYESNDMMARWKGAETRSRLWLSTVHTPTEAHATESRI